MSLSDCAKCWETPCVCGHEYEYRTEAWLEAQIAMLQRVLAEKRKAKEKGDPKVP